MPIMPNYGSPDPEQGTPEWNEMMQGLADRQQTERDRWQRLSQKSPGDWDRGLQNALQVGSRHGSRPGEWEYNINGEWVNQATYDDPLWRQNIFDPWQQGIRDKWAKDREGTEKWRRGQKPRYETKPQRQPFERSRSIGQRSSRGGGGGGSMGGGGGGYDPAMIAQLIGG